MNRAVLMMFVIVFGTIACGGKDSSNSPTAPSVNVPFSTVDLRAGTGTEATSGRTANVNYTLWLYSTSGTDNKGSQIQSGNFSFVVGSSQTIAGFNQGVTGMRVGGLRRIIIPPNLGYGSNPPPGSGIPANATLIFEVELLSVQ
jgi:FKBP-type peptidyl-prolyl cis-trans isomerase FkpA